jgi:hypothetical protein
MGFAALNPSYFRYYFKYFSNHAIESFTARSCTASGA